MADTKRLLALIPSTRDYYFSLGEPEQSLKRDRVSEAAEKATMEQTGILKKSKILPETETLEQTRQKRIPLQLLSDNGELILNPWYLPYEAEIVVMFVDVPEKKRNGTLQVWANCFQCG